MGAAAAKIIVKGAGDVGPRRRWAAVEQRLGRHQNAAETIAALAGLLLDKGLLQRMRLVRRAKTFDRGHVAAGDAGDGAAAGLHRLPVDQDKAAAALFEAAAEPRAGQA